MYYLLYCIILINLLFSYLYNLFIFGSFFVVGLILSLFLKLWIDKIWIVVEIDYKDIFKCPEKKQISFDAIVFSFAIGFSLLLEFSFFLFALNSLFFFSWLYLNPFESFTVNQLIVSCFLGGILSIVLFHMYLQRRI